MCGAPSHGSVSGAGHLNALTFPSMGLPSSASYLPHRTSCSLCLTKKAPSPGVGTREGAGMRDAPRLRGASTFPGNRGDISPASRAKDVARIHPCAEGAIRAGFAA
jgi:hypothetical protein